MKLGELASCQELWQNADRYWSEALDQARQIGNTTVISMAQAYRTSYLLHVGQFDQAESASHEAVTIARRLSHPWALAEALFAAAQAAQARGQSMEALQWGRESLSRFEAVKHTRTAEVSAWLAAFP